MSAINPNASSPGGGQIVPPATLENPHGLSTGQLAAQNEVPATAGASSGNRFNVESLGGGRFTVDGKQVNIENLFLHIANELSLGVQEEMKGKTEDMQIKNSAVAKLNEYISDLTRIRSDMKDDDTTEVWKSNFHKGREFPVGGEMTENGDIEWNGETVNFGWPKSDKLEDGVYKMNGAQMDAYIQKVKGKVEEMNANSQLEMIDLQELVSQNNRFYDMASNIISKAGNNRQTIAGNIRG